MSQFAVIMLEELIKVTAHTKKAETVTLHRARVSKLQKLFSANWDIAKKNGFNLAFMLNLTQ